MDLERAATTIKRFITGKLLESGQKGYIVGLSGGIDSALAASLAVEAIGADRLYAAILPYRTTPAAATRDAENWAKQLGIEYRIIEITPMIDAYFPTYDESHKLRVGNKCARERMDILFDLAQAADLMVLGTLNRTETCIGYATVYGDTAASINPLGQLYKTEIRELARMRGLPDHFLTKPPSADLWEGQTDEGEIGLEYAIIDQILCRVIDGGITSMGALELEGFDTTHISGVISRINGNYFKRIQPPVAPMGRPEIPTRVQIQP